jgi:excisionase family DNA binding protein
MSPIMSDRAETYQRVSVPEAAVILGVSVATVRRMIRAGRLQAERVERPQGIAYVVLLPPDAGQRSQRDQQVGTSGRANRSGPDPAAEALVSLVRTAIAGVLGPLVAQLDAHRLMVEHAQGQITWQAELIGRLTAERDAAREELAALKASLAGPGDKKAGPTNAGEGTG